MPTDHLLLRAARGESVERVPVWAMRQAGRWDPEFQRVRAGQDFFSFSEDVERSAQVSVLPARFGVDAVILFYDITTLPVAMGLPFALQPEKGPMPDRPIRTLQDLERLNPDPDPSSYAHITGLLARVREMLDGRLPVLVFAGAPFTVASYCIGTGKDLDATRAFARENPLVFDGLMERLGHATVGFVNTLLAKGGDAWQLFDSWAGKLSEPEYDAWAQRWHVDILAKTRGAHPGKSSILFVKECPYLDKLCDAGAPVVSLGSCHDLVQARAKWPHLVFQGNVPMETLRNGSPQQVRAAVLDCLRAGGGRRHILNLNHGVDKSTPPANFQAYVEAAREGL